MNIRKARKTAEMSQASRKVDHADPCQLSVRKSELVLLPCSSDRSRTVDQCLPREDRMLTVSQCKPASARWFRNRALLYVTTPVKVKLSKSADQFDGELIYSYFRPHRNTAIGEKR